MKHEVRPGQLWRYDWNAGEYQHELIIEVGGGSVTYVIVYNNHYFTAISWSTVSEDTFSKACDQRHYSLLCDA